MDFDALIDAARSENAHGIEVRRGKRYTSAAVRVELMRRHLGPLGLETSIVHYGREQGDPIVVRAVIADEHGRVLATGHAEEIRGAGNVNRTSALENAETSAIGRALAALGVSGGEFASVNEMEKVDAMERQAPAGPPFDAAAERDRLFRVAQECATDADLDAAWRREAETRRRIGEADPAALEQVLAAFKAKRQTLARQSGDHAPGAFADA